MPGPSKQPRKLAVLKGTDQPCRAPEPHLELDPIEEVPEPPEWLSGGEALNCWKRRATELVGVGVLTNLDVEFLGVFCQLEAKLIKLFQAGEMPHASILTQYKAFANELAIGPASRQKFKIGNDKPKENKFLKKK